MTSPSPASVPTEEDVARALCAHDGLDWEKQGNFLTSGSGGDDREGYLSAGRAVLDLFAPILAEKEREIDEARQIVRDIYWMALRYADGRQSYAPGMCNDALRKAYDAGWLVHRHQSDPAFARDGASPEYRTIEARALSAEAALAQMEGALARYIETVALTEGTDFIDSPGYNGPDDKALYRCSGRDENGDFTEEARAIAAAIRAQGE